MTEIHAAFRVKLPESQGDVFLTSGGLKELRDKINKAIGAELPDRCPPGVSSDKWFQHQANMANQQTRRLDAERRNDRLRGRTDAETAQNIVDTLNNPALRAGPEPEKLTMFPAAGAPDPRVASWTRGSVHGGVIHLESRFNPATGQREFRYTNFAGRTDGWQSWGSLKLFPTFVWTEETRHPQ